MTDLVERLRKPSDTEEVMKCWDTIRSYLLKGNRGSYARDYFEAILCRIDEERDEAATEIESLRQENQRLRIERDEWEALATEFKGLTEEWQARADALEAENQELRKALNECQVQAVKDGNAITNLKAWQAGAISCREAEEERISEYKNSVIVKDAEIARIREALSTSEQALFWSARRHHEYGNKTAQKATEMAAHSARRALTMSDIHREQLDRPDRKETP